MSNRKFPFQLNVWCWWNLIAGRSQLRASTVCVSASRFFNRISGWFNRRSEDLNERAGFRFDAVCAVTSRWLRGEWKDGSEH